MDSGNLFFYTADFSFPGRAGISPNLPDEFVVSKDAGGISRVDTSTGSITLVDVPGQQAFVITYVDSSAVPYRVTTISKVNEGGVDRLRMDSTFMNTTTRNEQTQPQPGTLVLSKGIVVSGVFAPIWVETYIKNDSVPGTHIERRSIQECATGSANLSTTSDIETTWEQQPSGWLETKEVIDPDNAALTSTWSYYQPGDITGPSGSDVGLGELKQYIRYDGYQSLSTYGLNFRQVITPFAGNVAGKTTTTTWDPVAQSRTIITMVGSNIVSKSVTSSGPTSQITTEYTSAGGTLVTSTKSILCGNDFGGQPVSVLHPDGTLTTYAYTRATGGGFTTVMDQGATTDGTSVSLGIRTTTAVNSRGITILHKTEAIGYGAASGETLDLMAVTSVDNLGRALTTAWNPDSASVSGEQAGATNAKWTTFTTYSCCGVATETDQYGITTYHAYDDLQHPIKTNRLGITTETDRNGLTTDTHRYAETVSGTLSSTLAGTSSDLVSRSVQNVSGTATQSLSPDPTSATPGALVTNATTISYQPAAGLSTRTVTTTPDNFSQTTDAFLDGSTAATSGSLSPAMAYSYDANATGPVTTQSYVDGSNLRETTTTTSDWAGRTLRVDYMDGSYATMNYNSLGQMVKSTDPDGVATLSAYNSLGQRTVTAHDFNSNGVIDYGTDSVSSSETIPALVNSTSVWQTTSTVWQDGNSNPAAGTIVSISLRTPDGLYSSSQSVGVANPSTSITHIPLDGNGSGTGNWTTTATNPDGTQQVQTYSAGLLSSSASLLTDHSTLMSQSYSYGTLNRPTTTTDSRVGASITAYLSTTADVVASTTDAAGNTTAFTYDVRGRRTVVDAPDTLDANGANLTNVTTTSYFPNGTVNDTSGGQAYHESHTYDYAQRQLALITYGSTSATTTWTYSPTRGFLTGKQYQGGNGIGYTYTVAGRLHTRTWARTTGGAALVTTYGNGGRLTNTNYSDSTPGVTATYDALNRPHTQSNGTATSTFAYDAATLALTTETVAYDLNGDGTTDFTRVLNRGYDTLNRPSGYQLLNGTNVEAAASYGYDAAGRLGNVDPAYPLPANPAFSYAYIANSNLLSTVTGPVHTVTNSWDPHRGILTSRQNKVGTNVISQYDYSVNALGQRTAANTSGTAFSGGARNRVWGYDSLGQLVKETDANNAAFDRGFAFDGIGNRTAAIEGGTDPTAAGAVAYTANALNQYATIADPASAITTPTYDADGNATAFSIRPGGLASSSLESCAFTWDAENRLISSNDGTNTTSYLYDSQSRRIAKTTNGIITVYVYDGWNPVAKYSTSNLLSYGLARTYLWGLDLSGSMQGAGGVGGLLVETQGSSSFYPTFDGNGNVSEYLDASGANVTHFEYDAFGNIVNFTEQSTGFASTFRYRFSTKPQDEETGLYYYGYRYYDPATGRWPSRDPIEERGGINLYGFVNNNGLSRFDLLGLIDQVGKEIKRDWLDRVGISVLTALGSPLPFGPSPFNKTFTYSYYCEDNYIPSQSEIKSGMNDYYMQKCRREHPGGSGEYSVSVGSGDTWHLRMAVNYDHESSRFWLASTNPNARTVSGSFKCCMTAGVVTSIKDIDVNWEWLDRIDAKFGEGFWESLVWIGEKLKTDIPMDVVVGFKDMR